MRPGRRGEALEKLEKQRGLGLGHGFLDRDDLEVGDIGWRRGRKTRRFVYLGLGLVHIRKETSLGPSDRNRTVTIK